MPAFARTVALLLGLAGAHAFTLSAAPVRPFTRPHASKIGASVTLATYSTHNAVPNPRMLNLRGGGLVASASKVLAAVPAPVLLGVCIILEIVATTCMKYAAIGPRLWYAGVAAGYVLCFTLFPVVLRTMPLSIAYAAWSGAGTATAMLIGAVLFNEALTLKKLVWTALIVAGVVGLNFC